MGTVLGFDHHLHIIMPWQFGIMVQLVTLVLVLLACMLSTPLDSTSLSRISLVSTTIFDVTKYGAKGDGKTDDSPAFMNAWKEACQAQQIDRSIIAIPAKKTFLLKPVSFSGPCKPSRVFVQVSGDIVGPKKKTDWIGYHIDTWLSFSMVDGLTVSGSGQIDGQGPIWWQNACIGSPILGTSCHAPVALMFKRCNGLRLNGLTHVNSPRVHITITSCDSVIVSNLKIVAPDESPNTDGINIASSTNVNIRDSIIGTGDDCIAISAGSSNVKISGITCGPGHGISIGALGNGGDDVVENVEVQNCSMIKTMAGIRIKSWQGGGGYARNISFKAIKFDDVYNPIMIDQFYCPTQTDCINSTLAVKISDISYIGIVGTSRMDNVINLSCSESVACTNVVMDSVYIDSITPGRNVYGTCINAHGKASHVKPSFNCLKP